MKNLLFTVKTITSLHCGTGSGSSDIDLPVAKSPVTGHPVIPGSSMKGVLKDYFKESVQDDESRRLVRLLFGPDQPDFASAISVGDAQLLALPVRSYFGTFAYLTSPLVLGLFRESLQRAGYEEIPEVPDVGQAANEEHYKAFIPAGSLLLGGGINDRVLLEEIDLLTETSELADAWASLIAKMVYADNTGAEILKRRLIIADDNVLNFMCQTALPVDAHIAIDEEKGTVRQGALWYEESVPPETIFYGVSGVDRGNDAQGNRADQDLLAQVLHKHAPSALQVGGKSTTGKGFIQLRFAPAKEN